MTNTFGKLLAVTTFGESHGPAIGCVVDGCPPGLVLAAEDFRADLERRATGRSRWTSQRHEADEVEILSGVYEGRTTGTPIALLVRNTDARPNTPTTPTGRNTDCAIRAAAGARRRARRPCAWQRR
jgi:chorismate synthase